MSEGVREGGRGGGGGGGGGGGERASEGRRECANDLSLCLNI